MSPPREGRPPAAAHAATGYANFRSPLTLLLRMLASRDANAYSTLGREAVGKLLWPLDMALEARERRLLEQGGRSSRAHPIVLLVGPPRSGSTLVYQALVHACDVSWLTNWSSLFPRSPIAASALQRGVFRRPPHEFSSYYGQAAGMAGANDGFAVWDRWLGSDRYTAPPTLGPERAEGIRRFLNAWTTVFDLPFVNKNNRNTLCFAELAQLMPTVYVVLLRRDPLLIAQSLLRAREQVQGTAGYGWGLASRDAAPGSGELGAADAVCDQLLAIDHAVATQIERIDGSRILTLDYATFCRDPGRSIARIVERVPGLAFRVHVQPERIEPFAVSDELRLGAPLTDHIRSRLAGLQWD